MDIQIVEKTDEDINEGQALAIHAKEMTVETIEQANTASEMRNAIKGRQKRINDFMDPLIKKAHEAHKALTSRRSEVLAPLQEAEKILSEKIVKFHEAEEAKRAEEQRKKDEEARLQAAIEAENSGNDALSEAIIDGEVAVSAPPVEETKVNGVSMTTTWSWEIADMDKVPRDYLIIDEKQINQIVRARKDKTNIPGIRVFAKKGMKSKPSRQTNRTW